MRPLRLLLSPLALAVLLAAPARPMVAAPSAADAARLEALLEERLGELTGTTPDAIVRAEAEGFAIRIPGLRLQTSQGLLLESEVTARAVPDSQGGYSISGRIVGPVAVFGPEGFRIGEITAGDQAMTGRWTADLRTLVALDARMRDVRFVPREGGATVGLEALTAKVEPDHYSGTRWTGDAALSVSGLLVKDERGSERLALQRLDLTSRAEDLDLVRHGRWNAALFRLRAADDGRPERTPAERAALRTMLEHGDGMLSLWRAGLRLVGLRQARADGTRFGIAKLDAGIEANGLDRDRGSVRVDYRHDGITGTAVTDNGPVPAGLLPTTARLELSAADLPRPALLDAYRRLFGEQGSEDERRQAFRRGASAALGAARSGIDLTRLEVEAADAGGSGTANLQFDPAAPLGLTGTANLTVRGFEALIRYQGTGTPNPALAFALLTLQGVGKPAADAQGRPLRRYDLTIGADGRALLNGVEIGSLFTGQGRKP